MNLSKGRRTLWSSCSLIAAAVMLALTPAAAWAIDVSQSFWGFDGQVKVHAFNILSVLVTNPQGRPFEGTLELRESVTRGSTIGAAIVEDVYIAPNSSRWVQFYPYINDNWEEWSLRWGERNDERTEIPKPRLTDKATILLADHDDVATRSGPLRRFPENLFPPMLTATDTLRTVVLDHAPRWEDSRRQAFWDWLERGGRLHLFKGAGGEFPKFSAQLVSLNVPANEFRVGEGRVVRHDSPISRIDSKFVQTTLNDQDKPSRSGIEADPEVEANDDDAEVKVSGGNSTVTTRRATQVGSVGGQADALFTDLTGGIFALLKPHPHHKWTLLYVMAVLYILAACPGVQILGRRRVDYRLVYGTLIGLIVVFSLGFAYVGRRGHGEAGTVNSVAIARQLPDGALDITSWSNVFVTRGADYAITHPGTGRLYSTARSFEEVRGVIRNGGQGTFVVDIPPYSSRPFMHRTKLKSDPIEVRIDDFVADQNLKKLALTPGKNFPPIAESESAYVLYGDHIGPLSWSKGRGRLELADGGQPLSQFLGAIRPNELTPYSTGLFASPLDGREPTSHPPYEKLFRPLIAWSLDLSRHSELPTFRLADDRLRLFVPADLPETMKIDGREMGAQQGRVLYVIDVLKPVKT